MVLHYNHFLILIFTGGDLISACLALCLQPDAQLCFFLTSCMLKIWHAVATLLTKVPQCCLKATQVSWKAHILFKENQKNLLAFRGRARGGTANRCNQQQAVSEWGTNNWLLMLSRTFVHVRHANRSKWLTFRIFWKKSLALSLMGRECIIRNLKCGAYFFILKIEPEWFFLKTPVCDKIMLVKLQNR